MTSRQAALRTAILLLVLVAALPTLATAWCAWITFPAVLHGPATALQDFVVMWVAGREALAGQVHALASIGAFNDAIKAQLGPGIAEHYWLNPPQTLLLAAPLALLPPAAGFAAWTVAGALALWFALRAAGFRTIECAPLLLAPAFLENALDGQLGALTAAALCGGLVLATSRPRLAGFCLAFLTLKPQLGVIVFFCLVPAGAWRALLWAMIFAAGWSALSVLCFGFAPWVDFASDIVPMVARARLIDGALPFTTLYLQDLRVTAFAFLRAGGAAPELAVAAQGAVAIVALMAACWCWLPGSRVERDLRMAVALAVVPLATGYAMTYDTIPTAIACLLLWRRGRNLREVAVPTALAWITPGIAAWLAALVMPGLGVLAFLLLASAIMLQTRTAGRLDHVNGPVEAEPAIA